jgi:hypothetical protein
MTLSPARAIVVTRIVGEFCYTRAFAVPPDGSHAIPIFTNGQLDYVHAAEHAEYVHSTIAEKTKDVIEGWHFYSVDDGNNGN